MAFAPLKTKARLDNWRFIEHYFNITFDLFENSYKPSGYIDSFLLFFYRGMAFAVDIIFFIIILVNLFCFIVYKQLLHDLASNTFVIKS